MKQVLLKLLSSIALSVPLQAMAIEAATPPELPSTDHANAWIDADPSVVSARYALEAAGHAGSAIASSSHEWNARVQAQRRNYQDSGANSNEWALQLERAFRINGKSALDQALGEVELDIARARLGEARHEAARELAGQWLDVQTALAQHALAREQLAFAQSNLAAVEKRKRAGDASLLDVNVARADLAEVQRQASMAATQLAKVQARLRVRFPQASPPPGELPEPTSPAWPEQTWLAQVIAEADPLKVAEGEWRKATLTADRARADRVPDPSIGLFTASEAQRNERIVGISLSIPLSGSYRSQRMQQAIGEAESARAARDRQRQVLEVEAAETYVEAVGSVERWRVADEGAVLARESARLTQRAYVLGETDLQTLLLARRQSLDAARAALEARSEALRWRHRLLIDAHMIWALDRD